MKGLLIHIGCVMFFTNAQAQNIFRWQWRLVNDSLQITGQLAQGKSKVVSFGYPTTKKHFDLLYKTIDEIDYTRWQKYQSRKKVLNKTIVIPFAKDLEQCQSIVIEIDSMLLNFPIEFLEIRNQAMAVFKPLVFKINGMVDKYGADTITLHKGFILRDPTSDPEDACATTFQLYPNSIFYNIEKTKPDDFHIEPNVDFTLISAHGFADSLTLRGFVLAGEKPIKPYSLHGTDSKLIYIDGCQQGVNWAYIQELAKTTHSKFYIAPIISNDAGESSTKTINWFFSYLKQTANPVNALWHTRKKLLSHYNKRIHKLDVINKSFIFRIYKI